MRVNYVIVGIVAAICTACGGEKSMNPLAATPIAQQHQAEAPAAPTVETQTVTTTEQAPSTPVVTEPGMGILNCDGPIKGEEAEYNWQAGANIMIREKANCSADFLLAIFYTPDPFGYDNQVLVSLSDVRVGPGETKLLNNAGLPDCGKYQADVWRGLSVEAVQIAHVNISPKDGAAVNTYTFGNTGRSCTPPVVPPVTPPPPPVVVPPVQEPPVVPPVVPPVPPVDPPSPPVPPVDPPVDVCVNIEGNQLTIPEGYERSQAGVCTLIPPPPPPVSTCNGPFLYNGSNPFDLTNSGDATELAYVQTNVSSFLVGPSKVEPGEVTSWTSTGNYPVVLVKAATHYYLYTNVTTGQILLSMSFNDRGNRQNISHVSMFSCGQ